MEQTWKQRQSRYAYLLRQYNDQAPDDRPQMAFEEAQETGLLAWIVRRKALQLLTSRNRKKKLYWTNKHGGIDGIRSRLVYLFGRGRHAVGTVATGNEGEGWRR